MFGSKRPDPDPLGVPLCELEAMLAPTSIKVIRDDNALLAKHEHYTIRIEVVPPEVRESENGPIRAVVRMIAELPEPLLALFKGRIPDTTAVFNAFAALGALYAARGVVHIGSRLTIYEAEDAWESLHLPLLLFTTICGTEAILGGIRQTMTGGEPSQGDSDWSEDDLEQVQSYLSRISVCTVGGLGLSAEFGLAAGAVSAGLGGHKTALFQLMADQPHPELGGGLFCLLQMPHRIGDEETLQKICLQLNSMEMAPHDLPPHFGAWCPGRLGDNPSYVTFLPNALHKVPGIAVNIGFWAASRAQWANAMLASLGVRG